jgi:hypothetical protein
MTSSVIPARLEFQCGHAALVSLPRIKGESSAQRNERITREKEAAQARSCDFCGPDVAIVVQAPEPETEVEPVVMDTDAEVLADLEAVAEAVAAVAEAVAADDVDGVEVLVEEPEPVVELFESLAVIAEAEAKEEEAAAAEAAPVAVITAPVVRSRVPRAPRKLVQEALKQFTVQYRVERLIDATDIGDALRRVTELGATDVLAISRE